MITVLPSYVFIKGFMLPSVQCRHEIPHYPRADILTLNCLFVRNNTFSCTMLFSLPSTLETPLFQRTSFCQSTNKFRQKMRPLEYRLLRSNFRYSLHS